MPDVYSLSVTIAKIRQVALLPDEHSIVITSNNLTLEDTVAMQEEIAPALLGWLKKDEASQ